MNIAICDDDNNSIGKLEEMVLTFLQSNLTYKSYHLEAYLSSVELYKAITEGRMSFQIYLLDIEMDQYSGIDLAYKIRDFDKYAIIIFVTSHREQMSEAFDVQAFHFLTKPIDALKLKTVLQKAITFMEDKNEIFEFRSNREICIIPINDILYFESLGRKIYIKTIAGNYEYNGTLKEIAEKVSTDFVQVHHSYIIHLGKIRSTNGTIAEIQNGDTLPISRTYKENFKNAFSKFISRNNGL